MVVALAACGGADETTEDTAADTGTPPAATPPVTTPPATTGTTAGAPPAGATAEMVTTGQQLFGTTCAACHGPDAKGTQLAPNLTDAEWINVDGTYDAIVNLVKTGVPQPKQAPGPMPPMGGAQLSEDQVKAVAAYVWSLGGGK
jgi:cbb3-type cytochrome c oxidase subunit III